MAVLTRASLKGLATYRAGRTPEMLAREGGPAEAVKLSGNESAFEPLPGVREAISGSFEINRYPDFFAQDLRQEVASLFGIDAEQVVPGCGSLPLLRSLVEATCDAGDEAIMPELSFTTYAMATTVAGAISVKVPMKDQAVDLEAMLAAITPRTRIIFVCTPNNPTSTALSHTELEEFLSRVPSDILVALDEAYGDFATADDAVDGIRILEKFPNVVSVRTFSKAYGLAGMRIGFAVAHPELAPVLRQVTSPFSVSKISEAAAIASLLPAAQTELKERITRNKSERLRITLQLREIGFTVTESHANFVWIPLGEKSAEFVADCEQRGVIIRAFPGAGVRSTIGTTAENDAFLAAVREISKNYLC